MASIVLNGDTSGSVTLSPPAVAGTTTITLPAATGTVMVSGNMPAFSVYLNGNQSISANTQTKTQFATKVFDTANCYDATTNFRFTPTVAGYYQFSFGTATNVTGSFTATLYKNGSSYSVGTIGSSTAIGQQITGGCLAYANGTTDYFEVYTYVSGAGQIAGNSSQVFFTGCMVRGA
jgi:hypothetical protein